MLIALIPNVVMLSVVTPYQGTLTEWRLSTADLLSKVPCFVEKKIILSISKAADPNL